MRNNFSRFFLIVLLIFFFVQTFEYLAKIGDKKSAEDRELRKVLTDSIKNDKSKSELENFPVKSTKTDSKKDNTPAGVTQKTQTNGRMPIPPSELKIGLQLLNRQLKHSVKQVKAGLVLDVNKKTILWQKSMNRAVPIASMTKMMTCLLMLEKVEAGKLNLRQKYKVTKTCRKARPTKIWLDTRENPTLESLSRAMMIKSANDAAWLVSEIVSGDAQKFIDLMNSHSKELGMNSFLFHNSSGLPEGTSRKNNLGSPFDLARLAELLLHFPDAVRWCSTKVDKFDTDFRKEPFILVNNNKVLDKFPGVNGMKTGFTNAAMFCSTVTCTKDGKTIIVVLTGMPSAKSRDTVAKQFLEWAFQQNQ